MLPNDKRQIQEVLMATQYGNQPEENVTENKNMGTQTGQQKDSSLNQQPGNRSSQQTSIDRDADKTSSSRSSTSQNKF
jgi:hypothetical protein